MPERDQVGVQGPPRLGREWGLGGLEGLVFERELSHLRGKGGFQAEGKPALGGLFNCFELQFFTLKWNHSDKFPLPEYLLCARHCSKCLTHIDSFSPHGGSLR